MNYKTFKSLRTGAVLSTTLFGAISVARADVPVGASFASISRPANWRETAIPVAKTLQSLDIGVVRVGMNYDQNPAELADMLDICDKYGLRPQLLVEYYGHMGSLKRDKATIYDYWRDLGKDLATRWDKRIAYFSAFNEPDLYLYVEGNSANVNDKRGTIPLDDYFQATKGFADGIHSVNKSFKVITGGYAGQFFHGDYTNRGYSKVLAPLFNDGTLDGINLHRYGSTVKEWNRSQQDLFDQTKKASGITRDINHYCDEFNGGPTPTMFLNYIWNTLGVVGNGGDGAPVKTVFAMPYSLFELRTVQEYGLAKSLEPWQGTENADTLRLAMALAKGTEFKLAEPYGSGFYKLSGANKTLWVWQNYAAYSKMAGKAVTIPNIPKAAKTLKVYRATDTLEKPYRTLVLKGENAVDFADLPTDETLMFVADAGENAAPKFSGLKLDFTTADGPVAAGYKRFAPQPYSKILGGYGYTSTSSIHTSLNPEGGLLDRSGHNINADRALLIDVPKGNYRVTVRLGSTKEARNGLNMSAQGVMKVTNISTTAGEIKSQAFDVAAPNGQIKIDFSGTPDVSGGKGWFVTALEIVPQKRVTRP